MIEYTKRVQFFDTKCDTCNTLLKGYNHFITIDYSAPYAYNATIVKKKELDLCDTCYEEFEAIWRQGIVKVQEHYLKGISNYGIVNISHSRKPVSKSVTI